MPLARQATADASVSRDASASQVLVLQDLGIPWTNLEAALLENGLQARPIRTDADPRYRAEQVVALVTVNRPVTAQFTAKHPHLRCVVIAFTGYEHVDVEVRKLLPVYYAPGYATQSVAEHALALALGLLRAPAQAEAWLRAGAWGHPMGSACPSIPGRELASLAVGIVGTGAIGTRVAQLFAAIGCKNLLGWSRTRRAAFASIGTYQAYTPEGLEALFSEADLVSLHLPAVKGAPPLVGQALLGVKRASPLYLVNAARGALVDSAALAAALRDGRVAGAAIDVFDPEPPRLDDPLLSAPNTILLPHLAFQTREALDTRFKMTITNLQAALGVHDAHGGWRVPAVA